jgi:hypothetical protein
MGDEAHTDDGAGAAVASEQLAPAVVTVEGGARPDGAGSTSDGASGGSSATWGSSWFKGLRVPAGGGGGAIGSLSLGATMSTMGASMRKGGEALRERMAAAVKDVQVGTSNNLEAASAHAAQLKGSLLTSFTGPTPQYVALRLAPALPPARATPVGVCTRWAADASSSGVDEHSQLARPHPPAGAIALVGCLSYLVVMPPYNVHPAPCLQPASSLCLSGTASLPRDDGLRALRIHSVQRRREHAW